MSEKEMWPSELKWEFIHEWPGNKTDKGFYDAAFGPILLRVIVRPDGRFQAATADDSKVEMLDPSGHTYTDLEDAKRVACVFAVTILTDGSQRLMKFVNDGLIKRQVGKVANFSFRAQERGMGPGALLGLSPGTVVQASVRGGVLAQINPVDIAECAVLKSILALADRDVPMETIAKWTLEQREAARMWAGMCHLDASDNDDVDVPPEPEHVKGAKRVSLDGE